MKTLSEHEWKADEKEDHGYATEIQEVFHDDVDGILGAGEAHFQQGESRLHEQHEHAGEQGPDVVQVQLHDMGLGGTRLLSGGCISGKKPKK